MFGFVNRQTVDYNTSVVRRSLTWGCNGFDGDTKARLQAERHLLNPANQTTTANTYAFAAPSLN